MKTVKEMSQLSGVSVRTLHYYDEIDLLKPTVVAENGYRYYDHLAILRLQEILLYRELDFPLKKIKEIVEQPGYDKKQALLDQIRLLELKRNRLDSIIQHAKALQMEEEEMAFEAYDQKTIQAFEAEAKKRWGNTQAYQDFEHQPSADFAQVAQDMAPLMKKFGELREKDVTDLAVQAQVAGLKDYISQHFYPCDKTVLAGLGQMYVEDNRFTTFIDQIGGAGTASFISEAIAVYCQA